MPSKPTNLLVDAHVHLHDCFDLAKFLEAARSNFAQHSQKLGLRQPIGILLLTECSGVEAFANLVKTQSQLQQQLTDWDISATEEATSLRFTHRSGQTLLIMAGRQVITEEGIEVLTLITEETVADGWSLEKTIQDAIAANSLPVLPWGVGKWIGKRGELVEARLGAMPEKVFAGDNGGRPGFWPLPSFCQAHRQLPGTDPLPLNYEVERPGSFGFSIQTPPDWNHHKPGESLKQLLQSDTAEIKPYGRSQFPFRFFKNQLLLRLNKSPQNQLPHSGTNAEPPPASGPTNAPSPTAIVGTNHAFPETADIESSTDAYASRFAGPIGEWLLKIQLDATLKMLKTYPNASVLEVGGGHGQLTSDLLAAGHSVTVVGSDESCKHRIRDLVDAGKCNFQVANILEMPYENEAFDVVISYRMLAHVERWEPFLKELSRVAKQAVIVDYPSLRSANYIMPLLFTLKKSVEKNTRPYTCYKESELLSYTQSLGWKVDERYAQCFWPMVLHRIIKQPGISSVLEGSARAVGLSHVLGSPIILKLTKNLPIRRQPSVTNQANTKLNATNPVLANYTATPETSLPQGSRVLVTGASGFTGAILTHKLLKQGLDVVAIARPTSNIKQFDGLPIKWYKGDVFDEDLINKAMEGVTHIFHMVTPFREAKSPDKGYYNVHVLSTQLLANAALKQPNFQRFVHVSTIGVHGHIEHPPADETYRTEPGDVYQESKLEGEKWIRDFGKESGLPVAIVRPASIYGPNERRLLKIYKMVVKGIVPAIGNGGNLLHFVHVDDLTDCMLVTAIHAKAVGETFICGSEKAMTFREMVELISDYYQKPYRFISLPKAPLFALADLCEAIFRPLGIEPPLYRRRLAFYTKDRSFNTAKVRTLIGFTPKHSDTDGLKEMGQSYVDQEWLSL